MKKLVTIEVQECTCDICGKRAYEHNACVICGKDFCFDCEKTHAIQYYPGVFFGGSGEANYCPDCDVKDRSDKHAAYRRIASLRREYEGWTADFDRRKKEAEENIKKYL